MTLLREDYLAATARAKAAKATLLADVADARERLAPDRLKADMMAQVSDYARAVAQGASRGARTHRWAVGVAAVALVGLIFRRPIAALSCGLFVQARDRIARYRRRRSGTDSQEERT
jgi:hypothetical protein